MKVTVQSTPDRPENEREFTRKLFGIPEPEPPEPVSDKPAGPRAPQIKTKNPDPIGRNARDLRDFTNRLFGRPE